MRGLTPLQSSPVVEFVSLFPLWFWQLLLLVGIGISVGILYYMVRPGGRWARRLRSRLVLGLPLGTLLSILFVSVVFFVVQGAWAGLHDPVAFLLAGKWTEIRRPVTYAFQARAYTDPVGIVTSSFAHASFSHYFGNITAALLFGWIAEDAFGHFPSVRGEMSFASLRTNPYVRSAVFFVGIVVLGLLMAAFSPGPVIGFSGVVFAMAGFAVVTRPLVAIVGIALSEVGLISKLYKAFNNPYKIAQPTPGINGVGFADVAILSHLGGFLAGALLGGYVLWRRGERPDAGRVYLAALALGLSQGMWQAYWYLGNSRYILFRTAGTAFVFVLVAVLVVAVTRSSVGAVAAARRSLVGTREVPLDGRTVATILLVGGLSFVALTGAFTNLATIEETDLPNDPVEVRDYRIGYTENTTNQQISSLVPVPGVDATANVNASGVIVASEKRNVWQVAASAGRIRATGGTRVTVGGPGWRETVYVTRTGWSVVGGSSTYRVRLYPPDGPPRTAFRSAPAESEVVIANRSVRVQTVQNGFELVTTRDNSTTGVAPMPEKNASVTVDDIRFERVEKKVYANYRGTRVQVAKKQEPGLKTVRSK